MPPSKSKALVLLKQLNALVRRVSKTGDTAKFNGRILNFLSGAFSIGERSGVNLRGEYAPKWEDVPSPIREGQRDAGASVDQKPAPETSDSMQGIESTTATQTDSPTSASTVTSLPPAPSIPTGPKTAEDKKYEFYSAFWSLQTPISAPPTYFQNKKSGDAAIETFKSNVTKVLSVFAEATKKERMSSSTKGAAGGTLTASNSVAGIKRKRDSGATEPESAPQNNGPLGADSDPLKKDYFFAKFLTSYNLIDLEVRYWFSMTLWFMPDRTILRRSQIFTSVDKSLSKS